MELPEDEFSELARERKLQGGHRKRRSPLRAALPLILVLIVAPALAWLTIELYSKDVLPLSSASEETTTADPTEETDEPSATPTETPEPTPTSEPSEDASPDEQAGESEDPEGEESSEAEESPDTEDGEESEEPAAGVAYDAQIVVLNGSGRPGHAAQVAGQLGGLGYANTTTGNYGRAIPADTTIYFSGPELLATAQNIAAGLQVNLYVESAAATGNSDIVIVLR